MDIDAEDLDGDGDRDIVLNRTSDSPSYQGFYIQIADRPRKAGVRGRD